MKAESTTSGKHCLGVDVRPWQLAGLELPHHALPLADGLWRAPMAAEPEADDVGLSLVGQRADGAGCFHVDWQELQQRFDGWNADQYAALPAGSGRWIAARVYLAAHAWLRFPAQPEWMVILNLTPDSFSDGGQWLDSDEQLNRDAVRSQAEKALTAGAKWLDLGAESTRHGAEEISAQQQLDRLLPAIELLKPLSDAAGAKLSVDTRNADVAHACLNAGAAMINDVSGFGDARMAQICADANCQTTLMHMRGTPATMQQHCDYTDLIGQIADEMAASAAKGLAAGLSGDRIFLDPGIGFSKTAEQNLELIAHSDAFRALGFPLLLGPSRKSFLAPIFPDKAADQRDCATAGAAAICAQNGSQILRLHSGEHWDGILVAARLGATKMQQAHPYNGAAASRC